MHISTPGNWVALDLDQLGDEDQVAGLVDDRVNELPALASHRDDLIGLLTRSAVAARAAGVAFAAVMIDTGAGETPLLASLTLAVIPWSGTGPGAEEAGEETVLLPAGEAQRSERVRPTAMVDGGAELLVLTTQYLVALRDCETLVVLTFTSPNVLVRDELTLVFRRIAETLELPTNVYVD
jgi:hypothetical protein